MKINIPVNLIYGDRGFKYKKTVIHKLGLPNDLLSKVNIHTVKNSCHFPMLENPKDFSNLIKKILIK